MCDQCAENQNKIEELEAENLDLRDEIKTLETEFAKIDKWLDNKPR